MENTDSSIRGAEEFTRIAVLVLTTPDVVAEERETVAQNERQHCILQTVLNDDQIGLREVMLLLSKHHHNESTVPQTESAIMDKKEEHQEQKRFGLSLPMRAESAIMARGRLRDVSVRCSLECLAILVSRSLNLVSFQFHSCLRETIIP